MVQHIDVQRHIDALAHNDRFVRWTAAWCLGKMGHDAERAVPVLVKALKDDDWYVRLAAASALGDIGPQSESVLPALSDILEDEELCVREAAAEALTRLRERAGAPDCPQAAG